MTDYLYQYIFYYIIIIKFLQFCKMLLNQQLQKRDEKTDEILEQNS